MAMVTLHEAAQRLSMTPLQVVVHCALHGIPCDAGVLDEDVLPALGSVDVVFAGPEEATAPAQGLVDEETDEERRWRVLRRVLEKLSGMGKYWPSRTEKRSAARGFGGSDVGLALRVVDELRDCGLLREEAHGGRELRVGLERSRRREIAEIVSGGAIKDDRLRAWIEQG